MSSISNSPGRILRSHLDELGLNQCLQQLERSPAGLDPVLSRCIRFGVAFHHAGEFTLMNLRFVVSNKNRTD